MDKAKLAQIKNDIKTRLPIIIAASSTIATIATIVYYQTRTTIVLSKEELAMMKDDRISITYHIDGDNYTLRNAVSTPPEK